MAAPAKANPAKPAPAPAKGPGGGKGAPAKDAPGKGPAGKGPPVKGPPVKGKGAAEPEPAPEAEAPAPVRKLKLVLFALGGVVLFACAATAAYIAFFQEPEMPPMAVEDFVPPAMAPRPPPIGPVRQGDLSDELWRRMGVRPQGQ